MSKAMEEQVSDRVVMRTTIGRRIVWMVLVDREVVWERKEPRGKRTKQSWHETQAREQEREARRIAAQHAGGMP